MQLLEIHQNKKMLVAQISKNLLFFGLAIIFIEAVTAVGQRDRRSPFKKHKIIVVDSGGSSGGSSGSVGSGESGWDSGGWLQEPTPPPAASPPQQHDQTIVNHHHHTIVEHHHHHHSNVPPPTQLPPPPPPQHHHQESFRIEFSKGKGKGWNKGGKGEFEESIDETWEELEREKKKKMEQFKGDVEETFDFLAKIPETIVTEIDSFGSKVKEELEKKKQEESNKSKGISIQVWKGKGGGGGSGGGRRRGENSESTEVVHHHHYHEGSSEEAYRPVPQPQPQPPPPKKHYQAQSYESVADGFIGFLDQIGTQFRVPVAEEEGYYSGEPWEGHGYKGKGKGFHWKGGRRR